MENINNITELKDPFLERILPKIQPERTSGDFTMQVMNQIYASVDPELEPEKYRRQMLWAYLSIGAGIAVIAFILFAIWPFFDLNLNLTSSQILNFISGALSILDSVSNVANYIRESSVQISIFFSIFLLFLIERLLRRRVSDSRTFLL